MRYKLGNMDKYPIAVMENASFFKAAIDEEIDLIRLNKAVKTALNYLFP